MSSKTLTDKIPMVFIFWQMGRELLYLTGVLESVDKKVDKLLRANYNAGVSALESALKCPLKDKQRYEQLKEARNNLRLAVEKEDGLRKALSHFYFAFCQHQLALCEGLKKRSVTCTTRVYRVRINAEPKQLTLKGNLHRGLSKDAMDHLLLILTVPARRSKKVAKGLFGGGVVGGVSGTIAYFAAASAAIIGTGGAALVPIAAAAGAGFAYGFSRKGKLGRFKLAIKEYLQDQFRVTRIRRLYSKQELVIIDRALR